MSFSFSGLHFRDLAQQVFLQVLLQALLEYMLCEKVTVGRFIPASRQEWAPPGLQTRPHLQKSWQINIFLKLYHFKKLKWDFSLQNLLIFFEIELFNFPTCSFMLVQKSQIPMNIGHKTLIFLILGKRLGKVKKAAAILSYWNRFVFITASDTQVWGNNWMELGKSHLVCSVTLSLWPWKQDQMRNRIIFN